MNKSIIPHTGEETKQDAKSTIFAELNSDMTIRRKLSTMILDPDTELTNVVGMIESEIESQLTETDFNYTIVGFKSDVAYHLNEAVKKVLGFSSIQGKSGMSGKTNPEFLNVRFVDGTSIKVPYGEISLPALSEGSFIDMMYDEDDRDMTVSGTTQRRHIKKLDEIIEEARKGVNTESIYGNTAIMLEDEVHNPKFIDLSSVSDIPLILNRAIEDELLPLDVRLSNPDKLAAMNISVKYGMLLSGKYGTGKTLLAFKKAQLALENGWTFIYSKNSNNTYEAMKIAGQLSGSGKGVLLFIEDIDLVITDGGRDEEMNRILNIMDGGETKNKNIISVFTTNHINTINKTFLRGKRVGSLIELTHLDEEASGRFFENTLGEHMDEGETFDECIKMVQQHEIVPAFLAEIVEKVMSLKMYREVSQHDSRGLVEEDVLNSIKSYIRQVQLVDDPSKDKREKGLDHVVSTLLDSTVEKAVDAAFTRFANNGRR